MKKLAADTWAQTRRWLVHLRQDRMALTLGIIQPLILLALVGPLLDHVVRDASQVEELRRLLRERFATTDYLSFLFSGIAVFTVLVNSILGGIPIVFDRETGFMEKILAAPVSRLSIVLSRFVYVVLYSCLQLGIISLVGALLGVRPENPWLAGGTLLLFTVLLSAGITVLSLALAFVFPHHSIFFAITGFLLSPLLVLSPTFVARSSMPAWMSAAATFNPMTYAIEPIRAAFIVPGGGQAALYLHCALALLAFDIVCVALAVRTIKRRLA
ncbi:MAG: hypothetical protein D6731_03170 [Planctomycetota bacterium]|nr:MAG: hypothetical protein D6731_03170 [Planctomycetota bacterium]